ncbi:hypothetical protein ID866_5879 [Astraeus odoratus]|nr:hypothetical protein ID866_5879 [Astraeus odoratus]
MTLDTCHLDKYRVTSTDSLLVEAQAEIEQLEKRERELLDELDEVRLFLQLQRDRIHQLRPARQTSPTAPITRLPAELLLGIIELINQDQTVGRDSHRYVKLDLARVSRYWRDLIWGSPLLWTRVAIVPTWAPAFVKAHVVNSAECLLDVTVQDWDIPHNSLTKCEELLDIVIPCRHRIRSLYLSDNSGVGTTESILERIVSNGTFPSLKRISIFDDSAILYPWPFGLDNAPSLDYISLEADTDIRVTLMYSDLKTLILYSSPDGPGALPVPLSPLNLTTLTLTGPTHGWGLLRPNTLHLPNLELLSVCLQNLGGLMEAIVTPRLRYFNYTPWANVLDSIAVFNNLPSKFASVQHLHLRDYYDGVISDDGEVVYLDDAPAICKAFPGVRRLGLHERHISAFFWEEGPSPADDWLHLQSLEICGLFYSMPNDLVGWLRRRKFKERLALEVTLMESEDYL